MAENTDRTAGFSSNRRVKAAYKEWREEEDALLRKHSADISLLSTRLGRSEGAIISRLYKLGFSPRERVSQ